MKNKLILLIVVVSSSLIAASPPTEVPEKPAISIASALVLTTNLINKNYASIKGLYCNGISSVPINVLPTPAEDTTLVWKLTYRIGGNGRIDKQSKDGSWSVDWGDAIFAVHSDGKVSVILEPKVIPRK